MRVLTRIADFRDLRLNSEVPTTRLTKYSTLSRDTTVLLHTHYNSVIVLRVEAGEHVVMVIVRNRL